MRIWGELQNFGKIFFHWLRPTASTLSVTSWVAFSKNRFVDIGDTFRTYGSKVEWGLRLFWYRTGSRNSCGLVSV